MSDLTNAILNPPPRFPTTDELADLIDDEHLHGLLRSTDWGAVARATAAGKSVFELYGGEATAKLREAWAWYRYESWRYRILRAYAQHKGKAVDVADWGKACNYWQRQRWGGLTQQLAQMVLEDAEIEWGCFSWRG